MRELFIYYRVRPQQAEQARRVLEQMQSRLCRRHAGLIARRLCRDDPSATADAPQTWMETYALDPLPPNAGITPELQAAIEVEARALAGWIDGGRHIEVFRACAW